MDGGGPRPRGRDLCATHTAPHCSGPPPMISGPASLVRVHACSASRSLLDVLPAQPRARLRRPRLRRGVLRRGRHAAAAAVALRGALRELR